jgi:uncharacterized protein YndB with AHSA1/START domain
MEQFELEYEIKTSPKVLYKMLSTDDGLQKWFAEKVIVNKDNFTFSWDGTEERAKLISKRENEYVKFQFTNKPADAFVEFKIKVDELTKDVALVITDFAEKSEIRESKDLWNKQVEDLLDSLGL